MLVKSKGPKETQKVASELAKKVLKLRVSKHAIVIALEGELGAGKTTFVKGFARALGIKAHVTSPTFLLMKSYKLKAKSYKLLVHIDAYRLKNHKELLPLGTKDTISDGKNIVLIEWSDRVKPILPARYIKIHFDHIAKNIRKIKVHFK